MARQNEAGTPVKTPKVSGVGYKQTFKERTTTPMMGGRMFYRPSTVTPQEMGILSDAEVQRRADQLEQTNKIVAAAKAKSAQQQLMDAFTKMYDTGAGQINSAYDNLSAALSKQVNPYAEMKPETVQATPQLNELLKSQGVSTTPLEQLAAVTQAQNSGQAAAYKNLIDSLGTMWNAGQTQQQQNIDTLRNQALQALTGNAFAYGGKMLAKDKKKTIDQSALIQLINAMVGGK